MDERVEALSDPTFSNFAAPVRSLARLTFISWWLHGSKLDHTTLVKIGSVVLLEQPPSPVCQKWRDAMLYGTPTDWALPGCKCIKDSDHRLCSSGQWFKANYQKKFILINRNFQFAKESWTPILYQQT